MKGINKVQLLGTVGKDPEVRTISEGNSVASFSIATNDSYMDKNNQKVETTEWHNVECWGKLADIVSKHVKKGSNLIIEGKIQTKSYDNKEGQKVYRTNIVAKELLFIPGGTKSSESNGSSQNTNNNSTPANNAPANNQNNSNQNNSNQNNNNQNQAVNNANEYVMTEQDFMGGMNSSNDDLPF